MMAGAHVQQGPVGSSLANVSLTPEIRDIADRKVRYLYTGCPKKNWTLFDFMQRKSYKSYRNEYCHCVQKGLT